MQSRSADIFECDALGTHWWIEAKLSRSAEAKITDRITRFELDYSRFLSDSYIGKLNDNKVLKNPPKELLDMLAYQRAMFDATNGIFNISVGAVLEENGYGLKRKSGALQRDISEAVRFTNNTITLQKDTRIDLGGFGKGWLIDQLAKLLHDEGITSYVINGGGDILVGNQASTLYIEHPQDSSMHVGGVTVHNGALASSSRYKRQWKSNEKRYSHIVETAKMNDAEAPLQSVHVRADTALLADTLATVFLIVDHSKRIELAKVFNISFLELRADNTMWTAADFDFLKPEVL